MSLSEDPHAGGTLSEMAEGTSVPNDAGLHVLIPSVPRLDQVEENRQFDNNGLSQPTIVLAADNDTDVPRSTRDVGMSGEVLTGTGDSLDAEVESKRMHTGPYHPSARGDVRKLRHVKLNRSIFDRAAKVDENSAELVGKNQARSL